MAEVHDTTTGGLHSRAGAREPGLTGGVPRADERAADAPKRGAHQAPGAPAGGWLTGHTLLAALYGLATVLLALAPEMVAEHVFGKRVTLVEPAEEAVKNIVGQAASGNLTAAAGHIWRAATEGGPRMLSPQMDFLLRLASTGTFAASMILLTLQHGARQGKLAHPLYARLNLGLAASSAALLALFVAKRHLVTWPAFLTGTAMRGATLALSLPPLLAAGPGRVLRALPGDLRPTGNRRAALYAALAALFFVESLGLVGAPGTTLRATSGSYGNVPAHLVFQVIGLSTHVLVPAAALCLKVLTDKGRLATTAGLLLNLALAGAALQHVLLLTRSALAGQVGPAGPLLLGAWGTALGTALYNMPIKLMGSD